MTGRFGSKDRITKPFETPSWSDLQHWRHVLTTAWATEKLFLQAHVTGYEESIMLSAYQGELLHCVHMRKRDLTEIGKTWAGDALPSIRKRSKSCERSYVI
jgi:hypothetical protein